MQSTEAPEDVSILRDLAKRYAEIAFLPVHREKARLWRQLNGLERIRPLVLVYGPTDIENACVCKWDWARGFERHLRSQIWYWDHARDDRVWNDVIYGPAIFSQTGGLIGLLSTSGKFVPSDCPDGAGRYEAALNGTEDPEALVPPPVLILDRDATEREYQRRCEVFDGIMEVRRAGVHGGGTGCAFMATWDVFVMLRGVENCLADTVDRPQWVHAWMQKSLACQISTLDQLESLNLLSLYFDNFGVHTGGMAFTDDLPPPDFDGRHVRPKDIWGCAVAQILAAVSPAMHEEFALQYEKQFLRRFGLASYGCCEPLDLKVDILRRNIPNLRRIAMSPFVNVARGAEAVGRDFVFSYRPNPAVLATDKWDLDLARRQLADAMDKARGCCVEIILKDVQTLRNEPRRLSQWTDMAMRLAEEYTP